MRKMRTFFKKGKTILSKSTGKIKMDRLKLGRRLKMTVKNKRKDWGNSSRRELISGESKTEEWMLLRPKLLRNV